MSAETPSVEMPSVGETLAGRYELLDVLGEGGMSVVFRAHDRTCGREVAVKLLAARYLGRAERERRLFDEAGYLERLRGAQDIVALLDHGRFADHHGWPFISTELLEGRALNWQLIKHEFTPKQRHELALGVARALLRCHAVGIVHRDLTPSNISVAFDPLRVQLFDFSHAAWADTPRVDPGDSGRLTGIFEVPGTSGYMAPEQASAAPPDTKMDVFAFGVLLYEVITGRNPYPNVSHQEFIELQRSGRLEPPRLQAWAYEIDARWAEIVGDCTQAEPERRPTMATIVERLAAFDVASTTAGAGEATERVALPGPPAAFETTLRMNPPPHVVEPRPAFARPGAPPIILPPPRSESDPEPIPPPLARTRVPGLVLAGIALTLVVMAAFALQNARSEPAEPSRASADAIVHHVEDAAPTLSIESPEVASEVAETGVEEVQAIESAPPPGPSNVRKSVALSEPRPSAPPSDPKPPEPKPDCQGVEQAAEQAKRGRDWLGVLEHTKNPRCWPSDRARLRLRVEALAQAKRWPECMRTAEGHEDPEIARWRSFCTKHI